MVLSSQLEGYLPQIKEPLGQYKRFSYANGIGTISGQFPVDAKKNMRQGVIKTSNDIKNAKKSSQLVAYNIIAQVEDIKKSLAVNRLLHVACYVQSDISDKRLIEVMDVLSLTLEEAFVGDAGKHSRSLVMVSNLPFNATMEVVTTFSYTI